MLTYLQIVTAYKNPESNDDILKEFSEVQIDDFVRIPKGNYRVLLYLKHLKTSFSFYNRLLNSLLKKSILIKLNCCVFV